MPNRQVSTPKSSRLGFQKWLTLFVLVIGITTLATSRGNAQTRFKAFNVNFPKYPLADNKFGIRYWNASFGASDVPGEDGDALLLFDPVEFKARLAALGETNVPSKAIELRLPFVGSGIDVRYLKDNIGESFEWEIVDSGSNDVFDVVSSGTVNTNAGGAGFSLATATLAPQGSLPTDRIHMLRLKTTDTDGLGGGGNWRVFVDSVDVYDNTPLTYDDDSNISGNWHFTNPGLWDIGFADNDFYEASRSGTAGVGETVDVSFHGTSLVLSGFEWGDTDTGSSEFRVTGSYDWAIDGGFGGSGTIDASLDVSAGVRWPTLLVNGLPTGDHTLTITNKGSGGAFPANFGYMIFDSLATFDSGISSTPGDFNSDHVVNGADFLIWQRGLSPSPLSANDLMDWQANYGLGTLTTANSVAVPEPTSWLIALVAATIVIHASRRSAEC